MLKPALQGIDRGRGKLKLRVLDVKAIPSRDSIAFVSQRASPATHAWVKVDGIQNYESRPPPQMGENVISTPQSGLSVVKQPASGIGSTPEYAHSLQSRPSTHPFL
jgi:hypothetical protein